MRHKHFNCWQKNKQDCHKWPKKKKKEKFSFINHDNK